MAGENPALGANDLERPRARFLGLQTLGEFDHLDMAGIAANSIEAWTQAKCGEAGCRGGYFGTDICQRLGSKEVLGRGTRRETKVD
jgi:hypothetical protein